MVLAKRVSDCFLMAIRKLSFMRVLYALTLGTFFFLLLPASAQVINDSIAYRLELPLNQPLRSSTAHCTVEWACVDEQLTGKCIEYHNDQWFYFTAADIPTHYLTITRQDCREIRGVQLVLLTGEACRPETYQVLVCVSLASQEDIYLKAEALEAGKTYLLNIDGYLHDFCSFTIQYSDTPTGLPVNQSLAKQLALKQLEETLEVQINWKAPASILDQTRHYELYRRERLEKKFSRTQTIPHLRNAYGLSQEHYSTTDTLPEGGTYFYKLLARLENGEGSILAEGKLKVEEEDKERAVLEISIPFGPKTPYTILLFDAGNQQLLHRGKGVVSKKQQNLQIPVSRWQKKGVRLFRVVLVNDRKGEQKEWLFSR